MGVQIELNRGFEDDWEILCNLLGSFGMLWDILGYRWNALGFFNADSDD